MNIEQDSNNIVKALQSSTLFGSLPTKQLEQLVPLFNIHHYDEGKIIIHENDSPNDLYVIWTGEVEVLKNAEDNTRLRISTLRAGEIIGEMGLLDNSPRSASIRTIAPTKLLAVSIADLKTFSNTNVFYNQIVDKMSELMREVQINANEKPIYLSLISNLANTMSTRMRLSNQVTVESLKSELELTKTRIGMGKFMINLLFALAIYMYALKIISSIASTYISSSILSIPIIIFFAVGVLLMMKSSNYGMEFYGLTLKGWRASLIDCIPVSIILILTIIFIKWLVISLVPEFTHLTMIHLSADLNTSTADGQSNLPMFIMFIVAYLVFIPLQELICRGALQSSLQEFLVGSNSTWWAIIISNILFSVTHLHMSIGMALSVLLPGFLWGWMYSRHKTLVGVSVSHLIVGSFAFFVFDIPSILHF
ncbi:MAG: cyclic nucleotide-binding domain-containing protein [Legionella sp.]|nr:cyclic nucleotide-binding domain-containing protein [Legionella sp.]